MVVPEKGICIGRNDYRYGYIGLAIWARSADNFISADTDMSTLVSAHFNQFRVGPVSSLILGIKFDEQISMFVGTDFKLTVPGRDKTFLTLTFEIEI